ncbi:Uncharacterized protein FKW44_014524, partial [Caligus rogercresseyi]
TSHRDAKDVCRFYEGKIPIICLSYLLTVCQELGFMFVDCETGRNFKFFEDFPSSSSGIFQGCGGPGKKK